MSKTFSLYTGQARPQDHYVIADDTHNIHDAIRAVEEQTGYFTVGQGFGVHREPHSHENVIDIRA